VGTLLDEENQEPIDGDSACSVPGVSSNASTLLVGTQQGHAAYKKEPVPIIFIQNKCRIKTMVKLANPSSTENSC